MAYLNLRLSDDELQRIEKAKERLQERESQLFRVTQRVTVLKALELLEAHLDRLDRDKGRKR